MDFKIQTGGVLRLDDGAYIPNDPRNRDWREYQDWIAEGNTPLPIDPPPPPPTAAEKIDSAGEILNAFLKVYAQRESLTLAQVRDVIKAQL
jgi:hypothetical protein